MPSALLWDGVAFCSFWIYLRRRGPCHRYCCQKQRAGGFQSENRFDSLYRGIGLFSCQLDNRNLNDNVIIGSSANSLKSSSFGLLFFIKAGEGKVSCSATRVLFRFPQDREIQIRAEKGLLRQFLGKRRISCALHQDLEDKIPVFGKDPFKFRHVFTALQSKDAPETQTLQRFPARMRRYLTRLLFCAIVKPTGCRKRGRVVPILSIKGENRYDRQYLFEGAAEPAAERCAADPSAAVPPHSAREVACARLGG